MKLTKKVLSLILAAALLLGTVVIAANAEGLTAQAGSVQTFVITSDKTDADGVTNVKIGETIKIQVYMTTNYYTGSAGGDFFIWTAGVFGALSKADAEAGAKNFAATFSNTVNSPANTGMYPSTHAAADYVAVQYIRTNNSGVTAPRVVDNQLVYEFNFTVLDDESLIGKTATFEIPAGVVMSPTVTGRKALVYQGISTSSSSLVDGAKYAETVDLSKAKLTINIISDVVPVEYCDYAALEAAVAKTPALGAEFYDAAEYKAWTDAVAAGNALLAAEKLEKSDENQKTIDDAAELVESTLAALDARYVDLAKLNAAVAASSAVDPADKAYYVAADYEAWEAALAAAKAAQTSYNGQPATKQAEVDAIADTLTAAYSKLNAAYVNLAKLNNAVDACDAPAYAAEYYDATAWANWEAALAAAKAAQTSYAGQPATKQAEVDAIADDLTAAYEALVPSIVDLTVLNNAIAASTTPAYAAEYYDAAAYAAWEAALAAAQAGVTTYTGAANTADNQAAVAALAKDLTDAFAALVPAFVSTQPITDAIAASSTPAYAAEYYDAAVYAAWEAALAAAQTADFATAADTEANRAAVAKVADDLTAAFAALVPAFVSYENLEKAVADFATPEFGKTYYTPDSWADYEAALAAANEANSNRPEPLPAATAANQAAVDKFADDLVAAYKALTPAGGSSIISVTAMQADYVKGDVVNFEVLCEGTGYSKIQILTDTGSTATYDRNHTSVKSITEVDGNEVWVLALKVPSNDTVVRYAKAKSGKSWDNGTCAFEINPTKEDAAVKSVEVLLNGEVVTEFLNTDVVTVKVVTGPAVRRIRIVNPVSGSTATYSTPAEVNLDGTKVWTFTRQYATVKDYDFDVYVAGSDNILVDSGEDLEFSVTKVVVPDLPTTGNTEDAVLAASVAKARILRGTAQTFTIATDKAATAVRVKDANGNTIKTTEVASEDGTAKTWVITATYANEGTYNYTVEALYGRTWIAGGADTAVSFKVIY